MCNAIITTDTPLNLQMLMNVDGATGAMQMLNVATPGEVTLAPVVLAIQGMGTAAEVGTGWIDYRLKAFRKWVYIQYH